MAKARASSANMLPNFTLVAPSIYEHTPSSVYDHRSQSYKDADAPSLILLCTWTGARARYVVKYTAEYQSLFPHTRIMVITTTAKDLCLRNSKRKQSRLKPAIERISSLAYLLHAGDHASGILMHVFSEGGSNKACELAEAYFANTGQRLPVSALCFDSTPGHPRYLRLCNALNKSLPSIPLLRHTGLILGSAVLGAIWITYCGFKGFENNVITKTRRRLLDPTHFDLTAPRCYLYSKNDALIAYQDVCEHANESILKGIPVEEVLFEESGHVGHAKLEPDRYWRAVMATWRSAGAIEEKSGLTIVIDEVEVEESDKTVLEERCSDADSQLMLLPNTGARLSLDVRIKLT
jgi:hypothetical protein